MKPKSCQNSLPVNYNIKQESRNISDQDLAELVAEFGIVDEKVECDEEELAVARLINSARGQIREMMERKKIKVTDLSKKLNVKVPTISRFLNSEGDFKISTIAVISYALEAHFTISLINNNGVRVETDWSGLTSESAPSSLQGQQNAEPAMGFSSFRESELWWSKQEEYVSCL